MKRIKKIKKPRNKPGYKETDRICRLCGKPIPKDKCLNKHHLDYDTDTVVPLHYNCHNKVHFRLKYGGAEIKEYGKDHGPYFIARKIIELYERHPLVMEAIKLKWGLK